MHRDKKQGVPRVLEAIVVFGLLCAKPIQHMLTLGLGFATLFLNT